MGQLRSSSSFFQPGPPAQVGGASLEIVDFLAARVEGGILDMGGGLGAYAHALRERGHRVTLAEKDPRCLEEVGRMGIPVLDMNVVPWSDLKARFDTVILVEVLEHVENPAEFLKHVVACAKKKVLLTVPCNDDFKLLFNHGFTYNHIAVSDHLQQFTSADIAALLESLGCRGRIHTGSHLFPGAAIALLRASWGKHPAGKLALLPLRILNKLGWLPRYFPSRIFAEVFPP